MHSAAMYSKYCRTPATATTGAQQQQQQQQTRPTPVEQPSPSYSSCGSNPASSNHSFMGPDSNNSLGYQDSSTQSFVDSDHSFHNLGAGPHKGEIPQGSLLAASQPQQQQAEGTLTPAQAAQAAQQQQQGAAVLPVPSYKQAKINPLVTTSTHFYVAANTLVQVSSGNDQWSSGYWRDNHRAVNVLESSLRPGGLGYAASNGILFVRLADVALNDVNGRAMYLASNRHRPCYVAFAPDTILHYNAAELTPAANKVAGGARPAPQAANFEPVDLAALQQHLIQQDSSRSKKN